MKTAYFQKIGGGISTAHTADRLQIRLQGFGWSYPNISFRPYVQTLAILWVGLGATGVMLGPGALGISILAGAALAILISLRQLYQLFYQKIELEITPKGITTARQFLAAYETDRIEIRGNSIVSVWSAKHRETRILRFLSGQQAEAQEVVRMLNAFRSKFAV